MNPCQGHSAGIGRELLAPVGGRQSDDSHPCRAGRLDSRGRVLDHHTSPGLHTETHGCQQVRIGTWLAAHHVLGTDENAGDRKTGALEARACNSPGTGGGHRPASDRQGLQQASGSLHRAEDWFRRLGFRSKGGHFRLGIQVRSGKANGLQGAPPVTYPEEGLHGQTLGRRPAAPLLLHVSGGVDQHTVEIEDHRATLKAFHGESSACNFRSGQARMPVSLGNGGSGEKMAELLEQL